MNISRDKNADGVPVHLKGYPSVLLAIRVLLLSYLIIHMVLRFHAHFLTIRG